jgi:hypothetical protein
MNRWIVWINCSPVLLPEGVEPTEENVNARLREMGSSRLMSQDVVNGVSPAQMMEVGNDLVKKFPGGSKAGRNCS